MYVWGMECERNIKRLIFCHYQVLFVIAQLSPLRCCTWVFSLLFSHLCSEGRYRKLHYTGNCNHLSELTKKLFTCILWLCLTKGLLLKFIEKQGKNFNGIQYALIFSNDHKKLWLLPMTGRFLVQYVILLMFQNIVSDKFVSIQVIISTFQIFCQNIVYTILKNNNKSTFLVFS